MARLGEVFPLGNFHGTIVGVSQCRLEGPAVAEFVTEGSQKQKLKDRAAKVPFYPVRKRRKRKKERCCVEGLNESFFLRCGFLALR